MLHDPTRLAGSVFLFFLFFIYTAEDVGRSRNVPPPRWTFFRIVSLFGEGGREGGRAEAVSNIRRFSVSRGWPAQLIRKSINQVISGTQFDLI